MPDSAFRANESLFAAINPSICPHARGSFATLKLTIPLANTIYPFRDRRR